MTDSHQHSEQDDLLATVRDALTYWKERENPQAQIARTHIAWAELALRRIEEQLKTLQGKYHYVVEAHGHWKELAERFNEQLETAEARANAAEAFIVRMDMAYRYEEFRLADPESERSPGVSAVRPREFDLVRYSNTGKGLTPSAYGAWAKWDEVEWLFEQYANLGEQNESLREAIAEAMTSLATGPLRDGYAYSCLERVSNPAISRQEDTNGCVCGGCEKGDHHFDRSLCACGAMHYYCDECGFQCDDCDPASEPRDG